MVKHLGVLPLGNPAVVMLGVELILAIMRNICPGSSGVVYPKLGVPIYVSDEKPSPHKPHIITAPPKGSAFFGPRDQSILDGSMVSSPIDIC